MSHKKKFLKYATIILAVIFVVAAAFLLLTVLESRMGLFADPGEEDGTVTYQGQDYVLKDHLETFLVLGLDRYDGDTTAASHESGVQTDFLMVMVFDNETKQSTAIQINRDTITKVNKLGVGGTSVVDSFQTQIALAYNFANVENEKIRCRNTRDSVQYLLDGVKIDHYFALTMDAVAVSCDLVDGVEVTVLEDFTGIDDTLVKGETVTLRGEQALRYVRTRYGMEDSSNRTRMERQQQYINALQAKVTARLQEDENFIIELVDTMDDYVVYDSSDRRMEMFLNKFQDYDFQGIRQIKGESKIGEEFMEFYPDEEAVQELVIDLFYDLKNPS